MKIAAFLPALLLLPLAAANPPSDTQTRLDAWIKGQPGGVAIAWVDADGAAFFQSGKFDPDDPRPITPDTQFEIGSVTKVFTSLLLAESERLGQVSRNDSAAKYLLPPGDPAQPALAKITLLALATHTSGLPRLPSNIGPNADANSDPYATYDRAALVAALRTDGPGAPAGRAVAYSNFGAAVLGEALAAAWGTSYAEALGAHVLAPLGLKATTLGLAGTPAPAGLAPGHTGGTRVPHWTFLAVAPAGAVRSTARDMAVLLAACLDRGEKSPLHAAIAETLKPQHEAGEFGGHIGLGWLLSDQAGRHVAWHNGATAGSHAFIAFDAASGQGVVLLANMQQPSEALGFGFLGLKPPSPPRVVVKNAADYAGRYPLSPAFAIDVTERNGALFAQATGQPQLALREVADDRFAIAGVPAEISFERAADGKVAALVLHQNGADQGAPRGELPPPPKEISLTAEALREYAGKYPLNPAFVLTVTEENGALFVQATGQGKAPVFAAAKDEFFYKVVDARLTFQRDRAGKVTGVTLHQNGRDLPAARSE